MREFAERTYRLKTGETVTVRSARPDDALAVLAHVQAVLEEDAFAVTTLEEFDFTEERERDWIRQQGDDPGKVLLVAETSRQIIGVLGIESAQRTRLAHCATLHMSVKLEWRNRGVGTALLESAIDWARSHPAVEKLSLAVFATKTGRSASIGNWGSPKKDGAFGRSRSPPSDTSTTFSCIGL